MDGNPFPLQYIFEANNNAQRIYSYTAPKYQAKAEGGSYSYAAIYWSGDPNLLVTPGYC